ncbi:phosphatidylserine decarboxylase-domain-containing protein [Sporodiniella umbellata]|nr:phosphatidylserine decarboxylase-domain-containing protein [Sporodiniella umbellata]
METEKKLHRRCNSANDVAHSRIPFVHRLSSFRRRRTAKASDELVSTVLLLKINIMKARHLNRDHETNVPNPYVTVRCGGTRQRTDTIKKMLDPEWACELEINLNDIVQHKKRLNALKKNGLCLSVYSKDKFSSIFLGQCSWPVDQLFTEDQPSWIYEDCQPTWYPLVHQSKGFYRRKKKEDPKEPHQPEICVQYGLILRTVQGEELPSHPLAVKEDWQYLTEGSTYVTEEEVLEEKGLEPAVQPSQNSFKHRFKKNRIKKNLSTPSVPSLESEAPPPSQPRKRRLRSRLIRRRRKPKGYYARFESDIMGITFLEIESAKDLPPEKNLTRTGFDMDPFVIVSYGSSTFRTRAIRHNLNPVWNEKLYFHVRNTQENYKIKFAVYDKDKFSNNDFVASQELSISEIIQNTTSSLAEHWSEDPSQTIENQMGRLTLPLHLAKASKWKNSPTLTIRAKFVPYPDIRKMFWVTLAKTFDTNNSNSLDRLEVQSMLETLGSNISETTLDKFWERHNKEFSDELSVEELAESFEWFMRISNEEDMTGINPVTKGPFFSMEDEEDDEEEYGMEDMLDNEDGPLEEEEEEEEEEDEDSEYFTNNEDDDDDDDDDDDSSSIPSPDEADYEALAEGDGIQYIDGPLKSLELNQEKASSHRKTHEKVIRLNECPICHRPNLSKRGQMDIVTHVATCAANDWTTVDRFVMGNFGSEAQAQRKWFVKLVSKVGYGKYSAGTNNANIIVQDRATGQLIDERMSVYIRLGMRLVYKGMRTGIQSKTAKRILANMSIKQGRRFDHPLSKREIPSFIKFHQLDLTDVLQPLESFNTFNEFFYRELKPGARPCDSPEDARVVVSPADCRMMSFQTIEEAMSVWIKGIEFSVPKLLDNAETAKAFEGGSLAIFRLAPQDYHRFHSPVDGKLTKIHHVQGQYYTVNPMAIRTTLDVYGDNKRDVVYIESETFGKVAIVLIGAMMVGSILTTKQEGDYLSRTDELGYFAFGGSTLVVLFEKDTIKFDHDLIENAQNSLETLVRVGNHIAVKV